MYDIGYQTDKGRLREINEDALFLDDTAGLYLVADGVGGHNAGELASITAVREIGTLFSQSPPTGSDDALGHYFQELLNAVNLKIYQMALSDPETSGMATTLLLMYLKNDKAYVANVGDSRAYLIRGGEIYQISEDHTYVQGLVKSGTLTKEEALIHPERHMITKAMGVEPQVSPDFYQFELIPEDVILLCTDGLYTEVHEKDMVLLAADAVNMNRLAETFVNQANANQGKDNITVICIRI